MTSATNRPLIDSFSRTISYVRLSVTDRCDLRCSYCMPERMQFLPKAEVLTLEELHRLSLAFIARGIRKIRLTGGEPLVRREVMTLINLLGRELGQGLDELTLTTNGTQLTQHADALAAAGVRRINVSLDTLKPELFAQLTRRDALAQVLAGIDAADRAGLKIKINAVALKGLNEDEMPSLIGWAHGRGFDVTLIEVMPLGEVEEDRFDHYLPLTAVRDQLAQRWTLAESPHNSGGPARYVDVAETGGRLGFITPLTNNFCASCNRVRVTATGQIFMCLGQNDQVDLRAALRGDDSDAALDAALDRAIQRKPERHDFHIDAPGAAPALARHMSMTGG
ncbi:GTP 3',8-cyclase MoaA [Blastomonas aquatica]|uniref:GTP 3',8-cyclase n=1 Tax=Blastomonas aquatica TaxID=1510276 RepID=A0ABQ1JGV5_9SPHN|nr:GTP 3',8-cyclase MoaA [Blastomonas aquatica]GGB66095.1 cyclic pyranopterin monophosphate synthase [Blastomonas aquatica]